MNYSCCLVVVEVSKSHEACDFLKLTVSPMYFFETESLFCGPQPLWRPSFTNTHTRASFSLSELPAVVPPSAPAR